MPTYNPLEVLEAVRRRVLAEKNGGPVPPSVPLRPWIRGFLGSVEPTSGGVETFGCARWSKDRIVVRAYSCPTIAVVF